MFMYEGVMLVKTLLPKGESFLLERTFLTDSKTLSVELRVITRSFLCLVEICPNKEDTFTQHITEQHLLCVMFSNKGGPHTTGHQLPVTSHTPPAASH